MNVYRLLYNAAMLPALATVAPFAVLAYLLLPEEKAARWRERLGGYAGGTVPQRHLGRLLWIHAVSVGEVGVAATLINALDQVRPGLDIVLSTTTPHGQKLARSRLAGRARCIYFPLDFIFSSHRALQSIRPDIIVCLETELWPNFLGQAQRLGIPTVLLNGRISERSFRRYRRLRPLLAPMLRGFAALAMISDTDARRIVAIGAMVEKVMVTGSIKGAGLLERTDQARVRDLRERLGLAPGQPVLVAGSIRGDELFWLPDAFAELARERADLVGVFAPRHLNRLGRLEEWFRRRHLGFQRYSELVDGGEARRASVILVDRMGALFDLYGVADLVFCGGSLVPLGGQNILEPAAWGKAVFYGPHMDNFLEASQILEDAGCGVRVRDKDQLLAQMRHHLAHPEALALRGNRGLTVLQDQYLIAVRQAELVRDVLDGTDRSMHRVEIRAQGAEGLNHRANRSRGKTV
jgi:3-deoxy-D-manno-octulosonic-acid transferase